MISCQWRSSSAPNDERAADERRDQHQRRVAAERERAAARERRDREPEQADVERQQEARGEDAQEVGPVIAEVAQRPSRRRTCCRRTAAAPAASVRPSSGHERGDAACPTHVREAARRRSRGRARARCRAGRGRAARGTGSPAKIVTSSPISVRYWPVRDQLGEAVGEALADDRADREHGEGGQERDQRQRRRAGTSRASSCARRARRTRSSARARRRASQGARRTPS